MIYCFSSASQYVIVHVLRYVFLFSDAVLSMSNFSTSTKDVVYKEIKKWLKYAYRLAKKEHKHARQAVADEISSTGSKQSHVSQGTNSAGSRSLPSRRPRSPSQSPRRITPRHSLSPRSSSDQHASSYRRTIPSDSYDSDLYEPPDYTHSSSD